MFTFKVIDANGVERMYEGFTRFNENKIIPIRRKTTTYLVFSPEGMWVVQECFGKIHGFRELVRYFKDFYDWNGLSHCNVIDITQCNQFTCEVKSSGALGKFFDRKGAF